MARMGSYFGTDEPEPGFERTQMSPPSEQPPMSTPLLPLPQIGSDPGEDAADVINEAALQYMNVDSSQMHSEEYHQLLNDLEMGYPDDVRLAEAIAHMRSQLTPMDDMAAQRVEDAESAAFQRPLIDSLGTPAEGLARQTDVSLGSNIQDMRFSPNTQMAKSRPGSTGRLERRR